MATRMKNPAMVLPEATKAIQTCAAAVGVAPGGPLRRSSGRFL
jgi:hypothetical protein